MPQAGEVSPLEHQIADHPVSRAKRRRPIPSASALPTILGPPPAASPPASGILWCAAAVVVIAANLLAPDPPPAVGPVSYSALSISGSDGHLLRGGCALWLLALAFLALLVGPSTPFTSFTARLLASAQLPLQPPPFTAPASLLGEGCHVSPAAPNTARHPPACTQEGSGGWGTAGGQLPTTATGGHVGTAAGSTCHACLHVSSQCPAPTCPRRAGSLPAAPPPRKSPFPT